MTCEPIVSTQVINEVCKNLIRKGRYDESRILPIIADFYRRCEVVTLDRDILENASRIRERHSISFYDGLIVAAALRSGVSTLWSEDMQHGLLVDDRLTIENPLLSTTE
ncbi:MAG: PIN domain-containing protein [Pirellulales bacterium]